MEEKKALFFGIEGTKFIVGFDPNKDGQPVMKLEIDILEVPDEIVALVSKKPA